MREIKFRGKRLDTGEWVYGDLITWWRDEGSRAICDIGGIRHDVNPATVGQYTELRDIRNQEICESDICRFSYTGMDGKERSHTWVVKYENGMYWLRHIGGLKHYDSTLFLNFQKIEVIGNIHDNPGMLAS